MHEVRNISIKSFIKTTNKNLSGINCAFERNHWIDYNEECYYHPKLKIYICKSCRSKDAAKKFHNVPKQYNGYNYQSTLESEFAKQLDLKIKAGLIKDWKRQVKIEINCKIIDGQPILTDEPLLSLKKQNIESYHICNYIMDFVVTNNDGSIIYYETKGYETELWKLKFRLAENILRNRVELIVIKKNNYKIKRKSNGKKDN